jgi:carbonic anhydrase
MQKLVQGIHQFQSNVFGPRRALFERLARGQAPEALFITCSDSRISPNLLTQTDPGDLFILRNAGNLVPPFGATGGGEAATVEYAVAALGVRDVVVCGHTGCGAMQALLGDQGKLADDLPLVGAWLKHAEATRRIVRESYRHLDGERLARVAVEENVLVQLENLRTHPAVASKVARGELHLHGWVYAIETGRVYAFRPDEGQFTLLTEADASDEAAAPARAPAAGPRARLRAAPAPPLGAPTAAGGE